MDGGYVPTDTNEYCENIEAMKIKEEQEQEEEHNAYINTHISNLNHFNETNSSTSSNYYGSDNQTQQPQDAKTFSNSSIYDSFRIIDENSLKNYSEKTCVCFNKGKFGYVYKCYSNELKKYVAVKKEYGENEKVLFEVNKLLELGHSDGIIPFYGIVLKDDQIDGVVMKLCDCSLRKYLYGLKINLSEKYGESTYQNHKREAITFRECFEIFLKITRAMAYVHTRKANGRDIVHADINTNNVCVDLSTVDSKKSISDIFLIDFSDERDPTRVGTPFYMAPELVLDTDRIPDKQSDVYSATIILWEMLTLETPPFFNEHEILEFHQNKQTLPFEEDWTESIKKLLGAGLNSEPSERPPFEKLVKELERILTEFQVA